MYHDSQNCGGLLSIENIARLTALHSKSAGIIIVDEYNSTELLMNCLSFLSLSEDLCYYTIEDTVEQICCHKHCRKLRDSMLDTSTTLAATGNDATKETQYWTPVQH